MSATVVLGELPALPLHTAGKYVAGAYIVVFALVLIYVVVLAIRVSRLQNRLGELLGDGDSPQAPAPSQGPSSSQGPAPSHSPPSAPELDAPRPESTLA